MSTARKRNQTPRSPIRKPGPSIRQGFSPGQLVPIDIASVMTILKPILGSATRLTSSSGFPRQQAIPRAHLTARYRAFLDTSRTLTGADQQLDRIFHAARDVMANATRRCSPVCLMPLAKHDHMIEALASDRADQSFSVTVLPRRSRRCRSVANAIARRRRANAWP